MKRVALIAVGSFNPPTIAHLRMLEVARHHVERTMKVVEGIMSPVADSYDSKPSLIKACHRIQMVRAAVTSTPWIRADDWECSKSTWTRTYDVLSHHKKQVQEKFGADVDLILVVGGDFIDSFPRILPDGSSLWNKEDIFKIVSEFGIIVQTRAGSNPIKTLESLDLKIPDLFQKIEILEDEVCPNEISSTRIRAGIRDGKSIKFATPDPVIQYIMDNQLYRK